MTNENLWNVQFHRTYSSLPLNGWWATEPRTVLNPIWMLWLSLAVRMRAHCTHEHTRTKRLGILWWPNECILSAFIPTSTVAAYFIMFCAAFTLFTVHASWFIVHMPPHWTSFNWKILRRNCFWHCVSPLSSSSPRHHLHHGGGDA